MRESTYLIIVLVLVCGCVQDLDETTTTTIEITSTTTTTSSTSTVKPSTSTTTTTIENKEVRISCKKVEIHIEDEGLYPYDIAITDSYIYILDGGQPFNSRSVKYGPLKFWRDGEYDYSWTNTRNEEGAYRSVTGIATDEDCNVYLLDAKNILVNKLNNNSVFLTKWGLRGKEEGKMIQPIAIETGPQDTVYIIDGKTYSVKKYGSTGNFIQEIGKIGGKDGEFLNPYSLTVDIQGNLYVLDKSRRDIQKFNRSGDFQLKFGQEGDGDDQFEIIGGIDVDSHGLLYILDTRLFKDDEEDYQTESNIKVFDNQGHYIDKINTTKYLENAVEIAIDSRDHLFIADYFGGKVVEYRCNVSNIEKLEPLKAEKNKRCCMHTECGDERYIGGYTCHNKNVVRIIQKPVCYHACREDSECKVKQEYEVVDSCGNLEYCIEGKDKCV